MEPLNRSHAFFAWASEHLNRQVLCEAEYDKAVLAAEALVLEGVITLEEWCYMVRLANASLARCSC